MFDSWQKDKYKVTPQLDEPKKLETLEMKKWMNSWNWSKDEIKRVGQFLKSRMMCKPRAIGKSNKKGKYLYPQILKNVKKRDNG